MAATASQPIVADPAQLPSITVSTDLAQEVWDALGDGASAVQLVIEVGGTTMVAGYCITPDAYVLVRQLIRESANPQKLLRLLDADPSDEEDAEGDASFEEIFPPR
ncbi:MAG TPA: hypothetical protein VEA80_02310 [Vitreimonas sp.]|uniref:hypothetical protein n=1 Tax=Vitreimonas sp. TaxID=3069702 RepID=UPI002D660D45|nr:hypothetical protein [Vitreimonas sp.]HYD86283.1 hypothetical protein [Vitreimonas sp.]